MKWHLLQGFNNTCQTQKQRYHNNSQTLIDQILTRWVRRLYSHLITDKARSKKDFTCTTRSNKPSRNIFKTRNSRRPKKMPSLKFLKSLSSLQVRSSQTCPSRRDLSITRGKLRARETSLKRNTESNSAHSSHKSMTVQSRGVLTWTDREIYFINHWKSKCFRSTTMISSKRRMRLSSQTWIQSPKKSQSRKTLKVLMCMIAWLHPLIDLSPDMIWARTLLCHRSTQSLMSLTTVWRWQTLTALTKKDGKLCMS